MNMKQMNKPDLNSPRFRTKYKSVLNKETFEHFIKKHPEHAHRTFEEYKQIVLTFNKMLAKGLIETRNGIELPNGLGVLFMATCPPPKEKNIDYKRSITYGTEASFRNWDSDNNLMKIFYTNYATKHSFQHKDAWAFRASKEVRHQASLAYKENWTKYIRVEPTEKISAMFDKHKRKEYIRELKPVIPESYDEFKM